MTPPFLEIPNLFKDAHLQLYKVIQQYDGCEMVPHCFHLSLLVQLAFVLSSSVMCLCLFLCFAHFLLFCRRLLPVLDARSFTKYVGCKFSGAHFGCYSRVS